MRPVEPVGTLGDAPERPGGRFGVRERGDTALARAERFRHARAGHEHCEQRLSDGLGSRDVVDRSSDVIGERRHGRHEERDHRIDVRVVQQQPESVRIRLGGRSSEHVDRVRETRLGRQERRQCYACLLGQLGQLQACGVAGIGAQNSESTGIREHGHPASLGLGLTRQQRRDVDQLFERGRTDDSRLVEQRLDGRVGTCQSGRVGRRGTLPDRRRSALQREDRLASRDPPRELSESSWVPEGLEVEEDDLGCRVVLPPFEKVVGRDVGLVPDRDERREPEPARLRSLEHGDRKRPALGRESDVAARREAGGERGVQARTRNRYAETVRADEPAAARPHQREQLLLSGQAVGADLREPGGDDDERAHARLQRLLRRNEDPLGGHCEHGEVDRLRDLLDRAVRAHAGDGLSAAVDRVRDPGEVPGENVPEQLASDRPAPPRRADDRHAARLEERPQRRRDRRVISLGDAFPIPLGRDDRELHLDLAALQLARELEARGLEDAEHVAVVREDARHEALDAHLRGPSRELLEQPGADAATLMLVGNGERSLRGRRVAESHVVRDGHDEFAVAVGERSHQRASLLPVRLENRLDDAFVHLPRAVKPEIEASLGE